MVVDAVIFAWLLAVSRTTPMDEPPPSEAASTIPESFKRLSLWLMPEESSKSGSVLQETIDAMMESAPAVVATEQQQQRRGSFRPHVTLTSLSEVDDVVASLDAINDMLQDYCREMNERDSPRRGGRTAVTLCEILNRPMNFHKSVFVNVELNDFLYTLRSFAVDRLPQARQRPSPYFPHVSLFYGELESQQQERLLRTALANYSGRAHFRGMSLPLNRIFAVDTTPEQHEEWAILREYDFSLSVEEKQARTASGRDDDEKE